MKVSGGGLEQSYNAQALVVDTQSLLVVVPHATQAVNDKAQVEPMLECVACLLEGLNEPEQQMKHLLKTRAGRAAYALRKQTVEPVFGIIKSVMGFRQFSMRGREHVHHEWTLVCLAWNLKRMAVLRPQ